MYRLKVEVYFVNILPLVSLITLKTKKYKRMLLVALLRDCVNITNNSCNIVVIVKKGTISNLDIKVFCDISVGIDCFTQPS